MPLSDRIPRPARRAARRGAAALALVALVVVPGYLGSRPAFFSRYPDLEPKYRSWTASTHAEAACSACHVPRGLVDRAVYRAKMVGEFYVSLAYRSRTPNVFQTPSDGACLACHSDLRTVSPEGDVRIPHRAHVEVLKMRCVECHAFLVHERSPEGKHTPPMSGCLRCHDGDRAKNACSACHTQKAAPSTHKSPDWLVVHGGADSSACVRCHKWTRDWCADCHSQRPRSHAADWRSVHGERVAQRRDCETCHLGTFCIRCHGEVPALNFDPTLKYVR